VVEASIWTFSHGSGTPLGVLKEMKVSTSTLAELLLRCTEAILHYGSFCVSRLLRLTVNHRPESRMRENRQSGSEGREARLTCLSYPYPEGGGFTQLVLLA
jgi:hypothetical protein